MLIGQMFKSNNVDSKLLKVVVEPAKEMMSATKAATGILEEINYALRSKAFLHKRYTDSGLDFAECLKNDEIEDDPRKR